MPPCNDVAGLVSFLSGRLDEEFVRDESDLSAKLNYIDERRDLTDDSAFLNSSGWTLRGRRRPRPY